jgi:hypothetical protein
MVPSPVRNLFVGWVLNRVGFLGLPWPVRDSSVDARGILARLWPIWLNSTQHLLNCE